MRLTDKEKLELLQDLKLEIDIYTKEQAIYPHLGKERYYVCEKGLIKKDEINNGFGLYYYHDGNFRKQKDSKIFKRDLYKENQLLSQNILVQRF